MTDLERSYEESKSDIASELKQISDALPGSHEWKVEVLPSPIEAAKKAASSGSSYATFDQFWRGISEFLMKIRNDIRFRVDDEMKKVLVETASKHVIAFEVDEAITDRSLKCHFDDGRLVFGICSKYFNRNDMMYNYHIEDVIKEDPSVALAASYNDTKDDIAKYLKQISEALPGSGEWKVEVLPSPGAVAKAAAATGSSSATMDRFWETISQFLMKVWNDVKYRVGDDHKKTLLKEASKRVVAFEVDESNTDRSLKCQFKDGKMVFGICAKYFNRNDMMYNYHIEDVIKGPEPEPEPEKKSTPAPSPSSSSSSSSSSPSSSYSNAGVSSVTSSFSRMNTPSSSMGSSSSSAAKKPCNVCKKSPKPGMSTCKQCNGVVGKCKKTNNCHGRGYTMAKCSRCRGSGLV